METAQAVNPIKSLLNLGQSVWLDYIRRDILVNGHLKKLIKEDGLRGMTSNPAIFHKAISGSADYDDAIKNLVSSNFKPAEIYEKLAVEDVQKAADLFRPVYDETKRLDGYVSLEVSPLLALDSKQTIAEAKRLWHEVGRPNVMIKVPGTSEGIMALEELISEGINVNVTLLFSQIVYKKVAKTYMKGLALYDAKGGDISKVASVASFFISRIDSAVDKIINEKIQSSADITEKENLTHLLGKTAIANAKSTYQLYKDLIDEPEWQNLAKKGAMPQRLLWASTSTKNPAYRDVYYVEELIGPDTVDTIPPATYDAFRDHGKAAQRLESDLAESQTILSDLEKAGIALEKVCEQLVTEGIKLFSDPFDELLTALKKKCAELSNKALELDSENAKKESVKKNVLEWQESNKVKRLWSGDASLWTNKDESSWLGWLKIVDDQIAQISKFQNLIDDLKKAKFKQVLLIGMGGSSLGPAVLANAFGKKAGYPEFYMLDSTVPEQIEAIEKQIDISKTLFIVSSKSGSTLEPNILKDYFFEKVRLEVGNDRAAKQFIAITDPGSHLEKIAKTEGFRHIFYGLPSIGGRYSVLSDFGMIPAAVMGIDIISLLNRAKAMVNACKNNDEIANNPGALLGIMMGLMANQGRDKFTFIVSPAISAFGAWLEQLLAESTGKSGKGIIPINEEHLNTPANYGLDRMFIYVRLKSQPDKSQDKVIDGLEKAGFATARIELNDKLDLAQQFFLFEFATAVAGSIMNINPFDQPDVEASKIKARAITDEYEKSGTFKTDAPVLTLTDSKPAMEIYADKNNWQAITGNNNNPSSLTEVLDAFLNNIGIEDYFAILAYLEMNKANEDVLQKIRNLIHMHFKKATCLGFGPRYLHSTGQVYKGGPNTGMFLEITADDNINLAVPGRQFTFDVVKNAQALGDYQVLCERDRRVLRLHIKGHASDGLSVIRKAVETICRTK